MAQLVGKYAAKRLLGKQMEKYKDKKVAGDNDPFYATIEIPGKHGKPPKVKKVKRQIPDYIPEHDAIILAKMRQRAYWLDCSLFTIFSVRFGWSSVIGLIPGFGDAIDGILAIILCWRCSKVSCGLTGPIITRMVFNIVFDVIIGLIPILGDVADASFRANSRNVRLLEERLDNVYLPASEKKRQSLLSKPPLPASEHEDFDDERLPRHRQDTEEYHTDINVDGRHAYRQDTNLSQPAPARVPTETRGGERTDRRGTKLNKNSKSSRR